MSKLKRPRESIDNSKCVKCGTENIKKLMSRVIDEQLVNVYKCVNGHNFQDSYLGFFNPLKKFHPPCPYKTENDQTTHLISVKDTSHSRYKCKTCKKTFTYHKHENNNDHDSHNDLVTAMDITDYDTNNDNNSVDSLNANNSPSAFNSNNVLQTLENPFDGIINHVNAQQTTELNTTNQNNDRVIYTNDNQIIHIAQLPNQNVDNNFLLLKVQHSSLGTYKCEFQQIASDFWPSFTDHQILHLIGYYNGVNEDCDGQVH